ncbi:hypothetical protein T492DRAFT_1135374 [Pavlovales sp. CCMP2436]|nr:hypothetical protein T492DRAFT_1135374 [Pavlovales sp. CCMP2436]
MTSTKSNNLPIMNNTQVMLKAIPKYPEFQGNFKEYIEAPLLDIIINDADVNIEIKRSLITLYNSIKKKTNMLDVVYEYAGGGCYSDLDMVKGHSTIAVEMAKTCGMTPLIGVQYYIDNFDTIVKETSEYYSADEDNILDDGDVKMLFNAIIYGGGFTTWEKALSDPTKVEKTKKLRNTTMRLDFITNFKNDIIFHLLKKKQTHFLNVQ